jgi:hypothetical protein
MNTSINTFKKAKTGNLVFPFVSKFGIVQNKETADYADQMADMGHDWDSADINAFDTFITSGKADGWFQHMCAIFPLWGDDVNAEIISIPLINKLGSGGGNATIAAPGSYDSGTEWEDMADASNGKIIGVKPVNARCLATPFTVADFINKPGFANAGTNLLGTSGLVLTPNQVNGEYRIQGAQGSGLSQTNTELLTQTRRTTGDAQNTIRHFLMGASTASLLYTDTAIYYQAAYNGDGILARHADDFDNIIATVTSSSLAGDVDMTKAALRPWSFNNTLGGTPSSITISSSALDMRLRWMAFDDGSLANAGLETAYRTALGVLSAHLGKNFF